MFNLSDNNVKVILASARKIVSEMETLLQTCHKEFELIGHQSIMRLHVPSPWLREAYARELAGLHYIADIDKDDSSEANLHRARRAVWVAKALEGAVRALLARAYVELAQRQPTYSRYKALGDQSLAYSQMTLGGNWEYFIPALLIWEDCELPKKQERNVIMLQQYGEAALTHSLELNVQIRECEYHPSRALNVVPESGKIDCDLDYFYGEPVPPAPYVLPRVNPGMEDRNRYTTRAEVESAWGCLVYDEAREANYFRLGGKWSQDHASLVSKAAL